MSEAISPEIFRHLVELAALELSESEGEYLRAQLNSQLKSVHELASIDAPADTPIATHGVPYTTDTTPPPRADVVRQCEAADDILAQAPQLEGRYLVVPDIPHTDLA